MYSGSSYDFSFTTASVADLATVEIGLKTCRDSSGVATYECKDKKSFNFKCQGVVGLTTDIKTTDNVKVEWLEKSGGNAIAF